MTPKTQSVCTHCELPINKVDNYWVTEAMATKNCPAHDGNGRHEPVVEPASTGEPPHAHEIENDGNGSIYCIICGYWCVDGKWVAARPSEPSAPQTEHSEEKSK